MRPTLAGVLGAIGAILTGAYYIGTAPGVDLVALLVLSGFGALVVYVPVRVVLGLFDGGVLGWGVLRRRR
jgi:hypothetical protein